MLYIHNSFTKQKDLFTPITPGKINMYVCGITVYDYCHIGHARTVLAFDVMYRYLLARGFEVNYVRNITDIDDKIIKRAHENKESVETLVDRFILAMHEDFAALGAQSPSQEPRATQTIPQMIAMITTLIANGYAYVAKNNDVYYHVRKFASYGALSHRKLDDLCVGARVDVNEDKQDPLDFVLWKAAKPGEPSWPSPWGLGRPGWHIECSAMATDILGETLDIHGGGHDLVFPHHENERAQSEGATGKHFVNLWIHTGFVEVDAEKMSKSLGNFFTIRDVLKTFDAQTVRFFLISSHYRSPVNYSQENLQQARACCERLYLALRCRKLSEVELDENNAYVKRFYAAMDDDFNTPEALSVLFDLAREVNIASSLDSSHADELASVLKQLAGTIGLLSLAPEVFFQQTSKPSANLDALSNDAIEQLIADRKAARLAKDFAKADAIRNELLDKGVILEDNATGSCWRRS